MLILDIEIYKNYFLCSFLNTKNNKVKHFEAFDGQPLNRKSLNHLMKNNLTGSFNGNNFDLPIIKAAIQGWTIENLKKLCDEIITGNKPAWMICKDHGLQTNWDHIDIIEVVPGQASLKIYGGRLNAPTIQDLPIEPDALIIPEQREPMRDYCVNDLETTRLLFDKLAPQIELRKSMSEQYGVDLRSKSDAQIAETVIKSELKNKTGKSYYKPNISPSTVFRYKNPKIISFKSPELKALFDEILNTRFTLAKNGSILMPPALAKKVIELGHSRYNIGIGGLHSMEKRQTIIAGTNAVLLDVDVASYYPSIILQQNMAPKTMGKPFLDVYQSIVERRLKAKKEGDKVTADTLKICVNGSFGKFGSKYSALYSPDLLLQTTLTGQLALLMLIERLEDIEAVSVVSANTDGVVIHAPKTRLDDIRNICFDWELSTSYELEETHYKLLASRDVNSYLAITTDDKIKQKGIFAAGGLAKNPDRNICYLAVAKYLSEKKPIAETIREHKNVCDFLTLRKVTGGAIWRNNDLGKAVRFYYSTDCQNDTINYKKNGNKVPNSDGTRPLMTLPDTMPGDIDYQRYIDYSNELLELIGYA